MPKEKRQKSERKRNEKKTRKRARDSKKRPPGPLPACPTAWCLDAHKLQRGSHLKVIIDWAVAAVGAAGGWRGSLAVGQARAAAANGHAAAAAWWPLVNARSTKPDCLHTRHPRTAPPSDWLDWRRSSTRPDADLKHLTTKVKREIDAGFAAIAPRSSLALVLLRVLEINAHSSATARRQRGMRSEGHAEGEQQASVGNEWCCKNVCCRQRPSPKMDCRNGNVQCSKRKGAGGRW